MHINYTKASGPDRVAMAISISICEPACASVLYLGLEQSFRYDMVKVADPFLSFSIASQMGNLILKFACMELLKPRKSLTPMCTDP